MTEQFDINRCTLSGVVQKTWDRGEDIFLRLAIPHDKGKPHGLTLRLTNGMAGDRLVTIQPGERILCQGYLVDVPFDEPLRRFLTAASAQRFLEGVDNPREWEKIVAKRVTTRLEVMDLHVLDNGAPPVNRMMIQGVVAKAWDSGRNSFARLAVYDRHTKIIARTGTKYPKRKPHYISVKFLDGLVDGRQLSLKKRDRIRIAGSLYVHYYRETLHDLLVHNRYIDLLQSIPNFNAQEICALRSAVYIIAQSMILFAEQPHELSV